MTKVKQKVALVLSGGGARGIAHIGVIEELEKHGFEITSIAGTSMGALIGGIYLSGKLTEARDWSYTLDKLKAFQLIDFSFSTLGLVKGDKVLHKLHDFIDDVNIEDLKIPYNANATDILTKKEVVIKQGRIFDAIRASISVPTVFTPLEKGDALLVDGGVLNNVPITNVDRTENDIVVAVDVNADVPIFKIPQTEKEDIKTQNIYMQKIKEFQNHLHSLNPLSHKEKMGYFNLIDKTIHLMISKMSQMAMESHKPDILINISSETCNTFDFFKAEELVKIGRTVGKMEIEKYLSEKNTKK